MTHAFIERARYYMLRSQGTSFVAERQWELADAEERRMLLQAVIQRKLFKPGWRHPWVSS